MTKKKLNHARPRVLVLEGLSGGTDAIYAAGGTPVMLGVRDRAGVEAVFHEGAVDALLLTGGGDVDPRRYGQRPNRYTYGVSEDRDRTEFRAVRLARRDRLPVLAICRGAQVLNVEAGGTLYQDLPSRLRGSHRHTNGGDVAVFEPGSLISQAVGELRTNVVHLHHQSVNRVGRGFRATAWHPDGTVEAIESTDGIWRVGCQFHPEYARVDAVERGLFRALVVQVALLSGLVVPGTRKRRTTAPRVRTTTTALAVRQVESTVLEEDRRRTSSATFPVENFWRCFRCQTDFDERLDYVDHMEVLHHVVTVDHPDYNYKRAGNLI